MAHKQLAQISSMPHNRPMAPAERTWEDLGFSEETLAKNTQALYKSQPLLAKHLETCGIHEHMKVVRVQGQDLVHRGLRRSVYQVQETRAELNEHAREVKLLEDGSTLIMGVGVGQRVERFLRHTAQGRHVILFESDPSLLTLALSFLDFTPWIEGGSLEFLLGAELWATPLPPIAKLLFHPLLATIEFWPRNHVQRRLLTQTKEGGSPCLQSKSTVALFQGELLVAECGNTLSEAGHDIFQIDSQALTKIQIARELALVDPSAVFSINFVPDLGALAGRLGFPYLAWEIDPSASTIPPLVPGEPAAENTHLFTWRRERVGLFTECGYPHSSFLPLAADTAIRRPGVIVGEGLHPTELSFVGSCMRRQGQEHQKTLQALALADHTRSESWLQFIASLESLEAAVQDDPCRKDIEERIREALSINGLPGIVELPGGEADLVIIAGEALASTKRISVVTNLLDLGIAVHGEEDWHDAVPGLQFHGPLGHGLALSAHYGNAGINIDINRIYQPDIVTLRTFEVAACGGFLIAEANEDVASLFRKDEEIVLYESIEELRAKVLHFLQAPDERKAIASAFHARFMKDHRLSTRLKDIFGSVGLENGLNG
ncbi:MAG: hypothetical protein ACI97A_001885 [Planctomycetota bacterium]|jgi:hypothetical protein